MMDDEPEVRIARDIPYNPSHRCSWCRGVSHPPWWPHPRQPPGVRFDPTLQYRGRHESPVVGRRFSLNTADLVDPGRESWLGFKEVEFLAWICREAQADEYRGERGGASVVDVMANHASCINGTDPPRLFGSDRHEWRTQLAQYLRSAILLRRVPGCALRWRKALGLAYGSDVWVPGPSVRPWSRKKADASQPSTGEMDGVLTAVLSMRGAMAWSLNTCHDEAIHIHGVYLVLGRTPHFTANYSYEDDASSWHETLAVQEKGEPLLFTAHRAGAYLGRLMDPEAEPPIIQRWAAHGGRRADPSPWVVDGLVRDGRASRLPAKEAALA